MINSDKPNILIVDDRPENLLVLESILEPINCNIIKATSGNKALSLMLDYDFALVLLDVQMPEMDGFETAELMKCRENTKYIPIIFVTAISKEQRCIFMGYEVGAVDYLFKPIEPIILQSKVKVFLEIYNQNKIIEENKSLLELKIKELMELQEKNSELMNLSIRDGLTGISNRRRFDEYINMCWKNSIRSKKSLSLIMTDIDYFKLYNDTYGHVEGDGCLIKVAQTISKCLKRPIDFVARYGGEEFVIVLPETNLDGAIKVAEDIRTSIEDIKIEHINSKISKYVTVSLGVVTIQPSLTDNLIEFIDAADKALYNAKKTGRNRVFYNTY